MSTKQYCIHGEENCARCAMNDVEAPTVHLHIVLDVSTSMIDRWTQTISGLNEYIAARRQDVTPYKVTITKFGLENEVEDIYTDADLDSIKKFNEKTFYPDGGGTALWGAVGKSLKKIDTTEPVLFIVITDGEENSSHSYSSETVDKLIEERQKLGNYTFAYLGVDKAAWGQETKVKAFAASFCSLDSADYNANTYKSLSTLTSSYSGLMRSASVAGQLMSVNNFFSPSITSELEDDVSQPMTTTGAVTSTPAGTIGKNSKWGH